MSYTPNPENVRVPQHLNETELRQALDELDAKIKLLHNRAHATAANSPHTYHEHAAALEAKRAKLVQLLPAADRDRTAPDGHEPSVWEEIQHGIENLRNDLRNIL